MNKGESIYMTGVSDVSVCPVCGGQGDSYLETKTSESEFRCLELCGYAHFSEIKESNGVKFWVETEFLPLSKDYRRVARPGGKHTWNARDFRAARHDHAEDLAWGVEPEPPAEDVTTKSK
jgi:hypothetical protein